MKQYEYGVWASVTKIEDLDDPSTAYTIWFPEGDVSFLDDFLPEIVLYSNGKMVGHFLIEGGAEPYDLLYWDEGRLEFVDCAVVSASTIWDIMKRFKPRQGLLHR